MIDHKLRLKFHVEPGPDDPVQVIHIETGGRADTASNRFVEEAYLCANIPTVKDAGRTAEHSNGGQASRALRPPGNEGRLSRLSWKWRKRSSVKIAERTYEKRAQALHC